MKNVDEAQRLLENVKRAERELENFLKVSRTYDDIETVRFLQEEVHCEYLKYLDYVGLDDDKILN